MFFLVRGLISIEKMMCKYGKDEQGQNIVEYQNKEIAKLKAGSYFGELALLREGDRCKQRRAASCIALTDCDARYLKKSTFNTVCEDFPELRTYLKTEADRKYANFSKAASKSTDMESKSQDTKESKAGTGNPGRARRDSITMALAQKPSAIIINDNVCLPKLSPSSRSEEAATKGDVFSLQQTLDVINTRLSQLELSVGRLGIGCHTGRPSGKEAAALVDMKPPTSIGGSAARRILTSPSLAAELKSKSPIASGNTKGWVSLRNIVRGLDEKPDTKAVPSPKRVDSGFSWT